MSLRLGKGDSFNLWRDTKFFYSVFCIILYIIAITSVDKISQFTLLVRHEKLVIYWIVKLIKWVAGHFCRSKTKFN